MPAVTVDPLTVPRLAPPAEGARDRAVRRVTIAPPGFEGEGFPVRRAFAGVPQSELDPFLHMDQMGEVDYAAGEPKGTPWHPHRGFETVTYMLEGTLLHQDSHGGGGVITGGATQWMTAGSGLLHIETPPEEVVRAGGLFHGIQLWVNLPKAEKMIAPAYQGIEATQVAVVASDDAGSVVRIIAGEVGGHRGPGSTRTPITLVHASVSPGARLRLPWDAGHNALVYVLAGRGSVGAEGRPLDAGQLAVLGAGDTVAVAADDHQDSRTESLEVLVLGGQPIREKVEMYGPFVMNSRAELMQAFADFQAGRLGSVPADGLKATADR